MDLPLSISRPSKKTSKNLEASFYQSIKKNQKKHRPDVRLTRIESWASQGVPDLVVCGETGDFSFWELKTATGVAVRLSPHQVAWMEQHKHTASFIIVRCKDRHAHVYRADQAVELVDCGLLLKPHFKIDAPINWEQFFRLTIPL